MPGVPGGPGDMGLNRGKSALLRMLLRIRIRKVPEVYARSSTGSGLAKMVQLYGTHRFRAILWRS
jgi:hypothetical protein